MSIRGGVSWVVLACALAATRVAEGQCLLDADGDSTCDEWELLLGCPNRTNLGDADSDNDGIGDGVETGGGTPNPPPNSDGDGQIDGCDTDSDNDTRSDQLEGVGDLDGDTTPNYRDPDDDGDAAPTSCEVMLGISPTNRDSDNDRIDDGTEVGPNCNTPRDTDGDTQIDAIEVDSDGDRISDEEESRCAQICNNPGDGDSDGTPNYRDLDSDDDGITDAIEAGDTLLATPAIDTDGDNTPDYLDLNADGDARTDAVEGVADDDGDMIRNWVDADDRDGPLGDLDDDTVLNAIDNCRTTPNTNQANLDGDAFGDACDPDDDGDGVNDGADNCPFAANTSQIDLDTDNLGDACDPDDDQDGVPDTADNCPRIANAGQENLDGDAFGDACDLGDADMDGLPDLADNCPDDGNPQQEDLDGDDQGDACDPDDDDDGADDEDDVCPALYDPAQADNEGDGVGDLCDPDDDDDLIPDGSDNCPFIANVLQPDLDGDDVGDECDPDVDGDLVPNESDNCPRIDNADQLDMDEDGMGDACDAPDADAGFPDAEIAIADAEPTDSAEMDAGFPDAAVTPDAGTSDAGTSTETPALPDAGQDPIDPTAGLRAGGAGLSCNGAAGAGSLIVLLPLFFLRRRSWLALLLLLPSIAEAQIDVQILRPAVMGRGGAVVESTAVLKPFGVQALALAGYANKPIQLLDEDGDRAFGVIDGLATLDVLVAVGLPYELEVGLDVPLALARSSSGPAGISGGVGFGDLSLWLKWAALTERDFGVGLAVWPELYLPTGDSDRLFGEDGVGFGLRAAVDRRVGPVLLAANFGGRFRDGTREFRFARVGQQLSYGAVMDWEAIDSLHAAVEIHGAVGFGEDAQSPSELLGSVRYAVGPVMLQGGGGAGLGRAVGSPEWRVFGALALTWEPEDEAIAAIPVPVPAQPGDTPQALPPPPPEPPPPPPVEPAVLSKYIFKRGERLIFNEIEFRPNSYEILPESYAILDDIVQSLQEQPDARVRIEGHTDSDATDDFNLTLSTHRALAVMNYLVAAGIDRLRLEHAGYGETRPVAPNDSPGNKQKNRRVELLTLHGPS